MLRSSIHSRRSFVAGALAAGTALALPGCATTGAFSMTEAIRRLLVLSSERAFARMTAPGGFWDQQVAAVGLNQYFGNREDTTYYHVVNFFLHWANASLVYVLALRLTGVRSQPAS